MRKILSLLIPISCILLVSSCDKKKVDSSDDENISNGLIAFFPFTGNAGDSSGNGNHGVISGATLTTDRNGITNQAYLFNGTNSKISIPFSNIQLSNDYAISVWFKLNSFSSQFPSILHGYSNLIKQYTLRLEVGTNKKNMNFYMEVASGNPGIILATPVNSISTGTFYHVLVNKKANSTQIFLNSNLVGSTSSITPNNLSNYLYVGENGSNQGFNGVIDDIRIYNRSLTQSEISQLAKK